jgi:UDP-N-acetylglucosamine 2-epimerase (non-hydrolysing)
MKLLSVAGARPNFMKLASIADAVTRHNQGLSGPSAHPIEHSIVHTGQHYDHKMSTGFFEDLGIPKPAVNLEVGSGSHAQQTAEIMKRFESVLLERQPDVLLVVGDVNSTIACTLVAAKIEYPRERGRRRPLIVHVEAGLRSFDRTMPEEINRILTDALSDLLFVTEQSGIDNLRREGVEAARIHFVGNVMIDTLKRHLQQARQSDVMARLGITAPFALATLHRPVNVDDPQILAGLVGCFIDLSGRLPLLFPLHPRTRANLERFGLLVDLERAPGITLTQPLGYLDFLCLTQKSTLLLSDSGGIQEETTYLGVPCITLRENTERPVTVDQGSNYLIGTEPARILETVELILSGRGKVATVLALWDGRAGERIIRVLAEQGVD